MKSSVVEAVLCLAALASLSACDLDPFGFTQKKIAQGYTLYVDDSGQGFALLEPGAPGGPAVSQIGWRKPFIIADVRDGKNHWQVFDTSTRNSKFLSDEQLRTDSQLRDIPINSAQEAWSRLSHFQNQW